MNRRIFFLTAVLLSATFAAVAPALAQYSAVAADPAPDRAYPAAMQSFQLPSHGALLNAFAYIAAGAGPHPTVILLHGFPGNERNLDLAQSIRRAGWNALYFDYRGSWGSPGAFSFTHCIEDTDAAIAYLRDPVHAAALRADRNTIVLAGHSMGGFMALQAGARDAGIKAVITISAADLGASRLQTIVRVVLPQALPGILTGAILAISRGAGEVAPILFTGVAYYLPKLPRSLHDQFMQLGYHVYVLSTQSPDVDATRPILYATVLVLLLLTFALNATAVVVRSHMRRRFAGASS